MIRNEQLSVFADETMKRFISRVHDHLESVFPSECEVLGDRAVRVRIETGIQRADDYNVKIEYDVVRFIDLMFILAEDYDINPKFPWANEILNDPQSSPTEKVDKLCDRAEQELSLSAEEDI